MNRLSDLESNVTSATISQSISSDDLSLIITLCERFEADWNAGDRPLIEMQLDEVPNSLRANLFAELLALELELRQRDNEVPSINEYQQRFPTFEIIVSNVLNNNLNFDQTEEDIIGAVGEIRDPVAGPLQGKTVRQRYQILRFHDRGGLGEVFLAQDQEVPREVALKQLKSELADDPKQRHRFLVEGEITAGLEHPGIVPVHGLGTDDDGRPFYAVRFIRGQTLKKAICDFHSSKAAPEAEGNRELEFRDLLGRLIDVCDTIAYAHSRGIIHRDIKPGNVMLGSFGETIVIEWGYAKTLGRSPESTEKDTEAPPLLLPESDFETTRVGEFFGTPAYMPPEFAVGRPATLDFRSDVYSLGATLYTLLVGKAPLSGWSMMTVLRRARRGDVPPPRNIQPGIDPALEAVCLKAMSLEPSDRYPTARALSLDIERWLADEPVTAWREPWLRRSRRWIGRHQTLCASALVALVLLGLGVLFLLHQAGLRHRERLATAEGRVEALESAHIRAVPAILDELGDDRLMVVDQLRRLANTEPGTPGWTPALLALLPQEPERVKSLMDWVLQSEIAVSPDELLVVREELIRQGLLGDQIDYLLKVATAREMEGSKLRLNAYGLLAGVVQEGAIWGHDRCNWIANELLRQNPIHVGTWLEIFQPISRPLSIALQEIYDFEPESLQSDRAFAFLLGFATKVENPQIPEDLAKLIGSATLERFERVLSRLASESDFDRAAAVLSEALREPIDRFDDRLAARQGKFALALMRLNAPDQVWPLFQSRDDPSVRTELIHQVADFGILPKQIIDRFRLERDINSKRALVLCLGVYPIESIAQIDRDDLASELLELYQTSPDAGLHGAIDWLLRHRWGKTAQLDRIKQELVFDEIRDDRDWFVNGGGQTFAIIRGPLEFKMGYFAPTNDVPRKTFWHTHLIPRSFAIGMRQVTVADYSRFLDSEAPGVEDHRLHNHFQVRFPEPECPVGDVSWYDAAKYCNWLSEVERIPREQWCYPEKIGPGMKLPEDHLERTGYRLPTIGEWEYACRAGTLSARPYGNATKWLRKYAWCEINAAGRTQPVGTLMPNDLGLFDVLGNLFEWCANGAFDPTVVEDYSHQDQPVVDRIIELPFSDDYVRHRRSFHFGSPTQRPYSARGGHDRPSVVNSTQGFRIVRTIPLEK